MESIVRAIEMSYLRGACGVNRWDGVSNERCGMRGRGSGVGCGVVEWVKRSTLRWFGHIERMGNEEFVQKVYLGSVEGMNRRGRSLGRWEDGVREYVSEWGVRGNGLMGWRGQEGIGRGGDTSAVATPLGDAFGESEASELLIN